MRNTFYKTLNMYRKSHSVENSIAHSHARSVYKTCIRKQRFMYDKTQTKQLEQARYKNAKQYWNMLKQTAGVNNANISLSVFEQYFRFVNNPPRINK